LLITRRRFIARTAAGTALAAMPLTFAAASAGNPPISPEVLRAALASLHRHGERIEHRDVIGIADFTLASNEPRFHLLNLASGGISSHLVAHGRGSDPAHTGWLERFSNAPHSFATSSGAFRTERTYVGEHGPSIRLEGLDATNDNASARGIVVHGAWYVSESIARGRGVLGRSEGCFALAESSVGQVLAALGAGRLLYAGRV
jgi:hypothetical protein